MYNTYLRAIKKLILVMYKAFLADSILFAVIVHDEHNIIVVIFRQPVAWWHWWGVGGGATWLYSLGNAAVSQFQWTTCEQLENV